MTTMQIAFFKHALLAGLVAALLGALAPLAAPAATALAQTTGGAASPTKAPGTTNAGTTAATSTTPATASTPATAGTPATGTTPAAGSTSGGAAPAPTSPSPSKQARATWYGPGFYGHTTACGQKLTRKLVGIASRTLPCGTLVRISYRGHVLTAPVLDRGPFGNRATWDLTAGAAHALAIKETVRIGTQIVGSVPNSPSLGLPPEAASPLSPSTAVAPTGGASAS
jgi:rare lipoprotein A